MLGSCEQLIDKVILVDFDPFNVGVSSELTTIEGFVYNDR